MFEQNKDFAHFRIIRRIGAGGMGEVFLAEDKKLHRKVALKVLSSDRFDDPANLERFQREARTAAQITHPNVTAIYDILSAPHPTSGVDLQFIVMEYVEGEELSTYMQERKLDIQAIVKLAEKVASGLAAAHKLNIVHRDIKADNILVGDDGEPKILDFGLAKPVDNAFAESENENTATISKELTKAGKIVGTVSYMSPEQARGEAVDIRSDIFSFGTLLYRMVTGDFPFTGPTQMGTLAKIIESKQEPVRAKNEDIPTELERIIDKSLRKDPEDRYQSSRELLVDIRSLRRQYDSGITDTVSAVVDKSEPANTKTFMLSNKKAVVFGLLVIILAFIYANWDDSDRLPATSEVVASENSLAILGFENKTGAEELDWLETGLPEIMLTDLAQSESINLISRERILDCFAGDKKTSHTYEECRSAARSIGAVSILSGSFYKLGDKIRIDARLEDITSGKIVLAEKVIGDDPFSLVDSLTRKIAASLNISDESLSQRSVKTFTSSSPEAYRLYQEGNRDLRKEINDYGIPSFEKALEIDSTFALPYMRIGMAHVFQGRTQQSVPYFKNALKYSDKLPVREKSLIDIYADVWLEQKWSDAYSKMKAFVGNYPDDKEGRTMYAILVSVFAKDTTTAFAHFDTVLAADPGYQLALSQYQALLAQYGQYDRAIEMALKLKASNPDSPEGYRVLARLYAQTEEYSKAIEIQEEAVRLFPGNADILTSLAGLYIRTREFDKTKMYLEELQTKHSDDFYRMSQYHNSIGNLENWRGNFVTSMEHRFKALEYAFKTGDTAQIENSYGTISSYHYRFGRIDSALYYADIAVKWSKGFNKISHPLRVIAIDPSRGESVRAEFEDAMTNFRKGVPADFWPIAEALEDVFEARLRSDTPAIVKGFESLIASQQEANNSSNYWGLAEMLLAIGEYDRMSEILEAELQPTGSFYLNAYLYCTGSYLLGRAYEGLGETEKAAEAYGIVLEYWGKPEIELDEIRETRERLAKLTG